MADQTAWHISSAVVATKPGSTESVLTHIKEMAGVEVHANDGAKIVIVLEGASTGILGEMLSRISVLDGVVAASMVFEHVETRGEPNHDGRIDTA